MAALAIWVITAAHRRRTGTRAPAPLQPPPTIPVTAHCSPICPRSAPAATSWPCGAATRTCQPGTTSTQLARNEQKIP
jgi:hypothetical protein